MLLGKEITDLKKNIKIAGVEPQCQAEIETGTQRRDGRTPTGEEGRMNWEIGTDMYINMLLCTGWISNGNLLDSTANSSQCSVVT